MSSYFRKFSSYSQRLSNLQNRVLQLIDLIDPPDNLKVIGTSESDFVILSDDTIVDFSWEITRQLRQLYEANTPFSGEINISFPGCEKIKHISFHNIDTKIYLQYVSGIDLSKLINLEVIDEYAFHDVGSLQKNFQNINLLGCNNLRVIRKSAFENVGYNSTNFENILLNQNNLTHICAYAFKNVAGGVAVDMTNKIYELIINGPNIRYIGNEAFAGYKGEYRYQYYKFEINCKSLKKLSEGVFFRNHNFNGTTPHVVLNTLPGCKIHDNIFDPGLKIHMFKNIIPTQRQLNQVSQQLKSQCSTPQFLIPLTFDGYILGDNNTTK